MPAATHPGRARRRSLRADRRGAVGLEFTFITPVMLSLMFGTYEATALVRAHSRVNGATDAVANLVSKQAAGVTPSLLTDYCVAAQRLLLPYSASSLSMVIASVTNNAGTLQMDWQNDSACPTTAAALSSSTVIADASTSYQSSNKVANAGDSVIVVSASYTYTSMITWVLSKTFTMTHIGYARPRSNATVPCTGC